MNYFELFGFLPLYDVDTAILAERYRHLQKTVHPDKFANASQQDKRLAVQRTTLINDGYNTLKYPILRAEHLLALKGFSGDDEKTTIKDSEFLMQQLEWRETLEAIKNKMESVDLLESLHHSFSDYEKEMTFRLSQLIDGDAKNDLQEAATVVTKLKFMAKLQDELAEVEDRFF